MFTRIGRAVSRHPVSVVVGWALLVVVSATLVFHGWGAGGLFERLASGEVTTPGTESNVVSSMTTSDDSTGEKITVVVDGVDVAGDYANAAAAATAAREKLTCTYRILVEAVGSKVLAFEHMLRDDSYRHIIRKCPQ